MYNLKRIAENHAAMVNNFTSFSLNTSNFINDALASNMKVYHTALEQTCDNLKACQKQMPIFYNQYQEIAKIEK